MAQQNPAGTIDVGGTPSVDGIASPSNTVSVIDRNALFGGGLSDFRVIGVGWDVTLKAFGESWLSEMGVNFRGSDTMSSTCAPAPARTTPGTQSFGRNDLVSLVGLGLALNLADDKRLRPDFFASFDDGSGADGNWDSGTLTCQVEGFLEAAPMAALGLRLAGIVLRRRKRS